MKANIRFVFIVLLLFSLAHTIVNSLLVTKKSEFETGSIFYISNNPKGVITDPKIILDVVESLDANTVALDDNRQVYFSNFSDIQFVSGHAPESEEEYIAVEGSQSDHQQMPNGMVLVGTYKETLAFNGIGNIGLLIPGKPKAITQIEMRKPPTEDQIAILNRFGFVQVDGQNIDRKIQAETYSLIELVINIVSPLLLVMALASWLSYIAKLLVDKRGELETLVSFGMSQWQVPLAFLLIRCKILIPLVVETIIGFIIAGCISMANLPYYSGTLLLLSWIAGWFLIFVTVYIAIYIRCGNLSKKQFGAKSRIWIFYISVLVIAFFIPENSFWASSQFWLSAIVLLLFLRAIRTSVIVKSLYGVVSSSSLAIFIIIALVTYINAVALSIWSNISSKEDLTVNTTMPFETLIQAPVLPEPFNTSSDFHKFSYINPLNGVILESKKAYPLVYSTDLERYSPYVVSGDVIKEDSVMIGISLATRNQADVGSNLEINGKVLKVSHIVESEQYAGMIVYLSEESFKNIFGISGNTIFGTDINANLIESNLLPGSSVQTREQYRELYRSSATAMMLIVFSLSIAMSLVSAFITYELLSMYINTIIWKLNVLRGFGISSREFIVATSGHVLGMAVAAIVFLVAYARPTLNKLSEMILISTDTFVRMNVGYAAIALTLTEVLVFSVLVSMLSFRSISRLSIYQQYIRCSSRN